MEAIPEGMEAATVRWRMPPTPSRGWPKWVYGLRTKIGETQGTFARRVGVSRVCVNNWETGDHPPSRRKGWELFTLARTVAYPLPPGV